MKTCRDCGREKPNTAFSLNRKNGDGLQSYCKACASDRQRQWHQDNPEKNRGYKRKEYEADPSKFILRSIIFRASAQDIPCDLTIEYVRAMLAATKVCPVLGIPLSHRVSGKREGPADHAPSIDRRRPELGYVQGNVTVISQRANRLKNDASVEEVRRVLAYMESPTVVEINSV